LIVGVDDGERKNFESSRVKGEGRAPFYCKLD